MTTSATPITPVATYTANVYPPQSGTTIHSADLESAEQAFCNRFAWLLAQPRVAKVDTAGLKDSTFPPTHTSIGTYSTITGGTYANAVALHTITGLSVGDVVTLSAFGYVKTSASGGVSICLGDASLGSVGILSDCVHVQSNNEWSTTHQPVTFTTKVTITSTFGGSFAVKLLANLADPLTLSFHGPWHLTATVYRTGL